MHLGAGENALGDVNGVQTECRLKLGFFTADFIGAGDRDRTGDIQLGKLTFCH